MNESAPQLIPLLTSIGWDLLGLLEWFILFAARWALLIVWLAWWLAATDWRRLWPALARGGWVVVVLLSILSALVWSQLDPDELNVLGIMSLGNFWWQLCAVGLLVVLTCFCGWLQTHYAWYPAEVALEPATDAGHTPHEAHGAHGHG